MTAALAPPSMMDTTIRPLALLEALAASTRTTRILALLRVASLAPNDLAAIGRLVSFLTAPGRINCLEIWAAESPIASELARLGRAAWATPTLLEAIRPVGKSHVATKQMRGKVEDLYLVAMAAARRATQTSHPDVAVFAERLRLLVVVQALEATNAGIPRELNIREICMCLRHAAELEFNQNWKWLLRIAHPENVCLAEFISGTLFRCEEALSSLEPPLPDADQRKALRYLSAVLVGKRDAVAHVGETSKGSQAPEVLTFQATMLPEQRPTASAPKVDGVSEVESDSIVSAVSDAGEEQLFLVTDVASKRPPRAQRAEGTGLILQSLEEIQFLRHSWHRLGPHEVHAFFSRLTELHQGDELRDRLGSALVGIATAASVPLSRMSRIRVQSEVTDDWTVDLKRGLLQRRPPRPSRRWRGTPNTAGWIRPMIEAWKIELPKTTQSILLSIRKRGGVSLKELWDSVSPDASLEHWFGNSFATGAELSRLTSPIVPGILTQSLFEANNDHTEARLLTSSTRSALPAACMYSSFRGDEVRTTWELGLDPRLGSILSPQTGAQGNAAGSELDVDLVRLRKAIGALTRRVDATAVVANEWVEHHNVLTALCIVTLFASTGARPVTSPFESLRWFDFDRRLVYVEDKRSGPTQGARLCVLSDVAHRLVTDSYLPHLARLQQSLAPRAPRFSEQLRRLADRAADCGLPLFFFLRVQPDFDWIEISSTELDIVCADPWPLPWNLFRHVFSTQLRRKGLPADIRDALLSHGDAGAESHGEFSWRTPSEDLERARPLVNSLAHDLGLLLPSEGVAPLISEAHLTDPDFSLRPSFGRQAREVRREKAHAAAQRAAEADIHRVLAGRPPDSLSAEEWERIARHMIMREDGMPHPMASIRAEAFESFLAHLWHDKRIRVDARRRYIPFAEGRACFNEDVLMAPSQIASLRVALDAAAESATGQLRPELAGCVAALELALHCRISNFAVLVAVACNHARVNVVHFLGRFWLEYSYHGVWTNGRPVYRVPITTRACDWIAVRRGTKKRLKALPSIPVALANFGGIRADRFADVLRRVCGLVSQANAFELTGVLAAMLRGTRHSSALPHSDWVRLMHRQALAADDESSPDSEAGATIDDAAQFVSKHRRGPEVEDSDEQTRCATLFDAIQEELKQPRGVSTRQMEAKVLRLVKSSGFDQGTAPFVLAQYVRYLLMRLKSRAESKTLKASTAQRYWYALKAGVLDFAYDVYLPALDDLEITELYRKIVKAAETPPESGEETNVDPREGKARRRKLKTDTDAGHRTRKEIWDFHHFARDIYGLEDPDWSEVSPGIAGGSGRPGLVLVEEYEAILSTMARVGSCGDLNDETLSAAFVLMICARFGLRIGEAVGMSYGDWLEVSGATVVLVRSSAIRGLKSIASKRQVPLVEQLNALVLTITLN